MCNLVSYLRVQFTCSRAAALGGSAATQAEEVSNINTARQVWLLT